MNDVIRSVVVAVKFHLNAYSPSQLHYLGVGQMVSEQGYRSDAMQFQLWKVCKGVGNRGISPQISTSCCKFKPAPTIFFTVSPPKRKKLKSCVRQCA